MKKRFPYSPNIGPPPAKVLDVGAGLGAFSKRLLEGGYEVVAIEGFLDFVVDSVTVHRCNINEDWPAELRSQFDFIVGIEVIEHVENPFHFVRQAKLMLKQVPHAGILITTPNPLNVADRVKFLLSGTVALLDHEDHRTPVFPQTIQQICEDTETEVASRHFDVDKNKYSSSVLGYLRRAVFGILGTMVGNMAYPISGYRSIEGS